MSLLELPPELWEEIASYLSDPDIQQLRLTCDTMATWFISPIRDPCFLLLDETAMVKLLELSLHESFAKHVKSIRFDNFLLRDYYPISAEGEQEDDLASSS